MAKKMLINALHPEEARVAIVEEGRLVDLDVEIAGSEQTRGNIYKGVVLRVEPGLQAAFVDIGLKKPGFLQMGELHPDWWQWRDDASEEARRKRPRIQEVLRRGQELIVQVEKGERDMKGAALTTYLSLPGRYMVVMPGSDSTGISRKVESESERKKLKELVKEMVIPPGIGYIIRTEAVGKKLEELQKDLDQLVAAFEEIRQQGKETKAPALIYKEYSVVIRTIRDYFTAEIDEVLVDSKEVYKEAKAFFKETMPKYEKLVKMHQEKRPIFSRYQLEEQIDQIYEKKVPLKSGGSLVIEPTEALVSIDVNSGKSTGERGVEDTAFKTNMEAAEEAARQLRLRDLGGLIVIDFIDMRERKHNAEVEKTLKSALKADKARVTVGKISQFGMLEMSRQRIRQTLDQASVLECPHCSGRGKVKSVENMAISFLRKVHAAAAKGNVGEVRGGLPLEVAYYLLNRKKRDLAQIENDYDIEVTIKGKPSFLMNQLELELVKREKPAQAEPVPEEKVGRVPAAPPEEEVEAAVVPAGEGEEKGKKKRQRGKKKPLVEEAVVAGEEGGGEEALAALEPAAAEAAMEPAAGEEHPEEQKKKRRRRRRRGKGKHAEGAPEAALAGEQEGEAPLAAEAEEAPAPGELPAGEEHPEEQKKKRRRRRRRGKGKHEEGVGETVVEVTAEAPSMPAEAEQAPAAVPPAAARPAAEEAPAKGRRPRKKATEAAPVEELPREPAIPAPAPEAAQPPQAAEAAKRPKRARKPKEAAPVAEALPAAETPAAPEKPKAKRAPRKKKEPAPEPE